MPGNCWCAIPIVDGDCPENHLNKNNEPGDKCWANSCWLNLAPLGNDRCEHDKYRCEPCEVAMHLLHEGVKALGGVEAALAKRPIWTSHARVGYADMAPKDNKKIDGNRRSYCDAWQPLT